MKTLLLSRLLFAFVWVVACVVALLSELAILPVAYIRQDPAGQYATQMIGIVLALACIYVSLKWYKFSFIQRRLTDDSDARQYQRLGLVRVLIIAVPVLYNIVMYYATLNGQLSFCFLISMLASVFCWPKPKA